MALFLQSPTASSTFIYTLGRTMAEVAVSRREVDFMPVDTESRFVQLATPKQSKRVWYTSFDDRYVWGSADAMWPVSEAALKAMATDRLKQLALPKNDHWQLQPIKPAFEYSCGRSSQIWSTQTPALHAVASDRVKELAQHKTASPVYLANHLPQFTYSAGRVSSIWEVNQAAMKCGYRPRTMELARPKQLHPLYKPSMAHSVGTQTLKSYTTTAHTAELAKPKKKLEGKFRDAEWPVSLASRQAMASERTLELARPKRFNEGYKPCRSPIWKVGLGPLNAVASHRLEELSKPIIRETMDSVQFNPNAFQVSKAAMKAKPSARIEELAQPTQR